MNFTSSTAKRVKACRKLGQNQIVKPFRFPIADSRPTPPIPSPLKLSIETMSKQQGLETGRDITQQRLDQYVEDQMNNLEYFSAEGTRYYRAWAEGDLKRYDRHSEGAEAKETTLEPSAFATPILKARREGPNPKEIPKASSDSPIPLFGTPAGKTHMCKDQTAQCLPDNPPHAKKGEKRKAKMTKENAKKADQLVEEEAEYQHRLAERRDRRRAKAKVLKPPPPASSSSTSSGESGTPPAKRSRAKKARKKSVKVVPGIALMQNFSADNLGKSRITASLSPDVLISRLKPSQLESRNNGLGLFGKGVSSAQAPRARQRHNGSANKESMLTQYFATQKCRSSKLLKRITSSPKASRKRAKKVVETESGSSSASSSDSEQTPAKMTPEKRPKPCKKVISMEEVRRPKPSDSSNRQVDPPDSADHSGESMAENPGPGQRYLSPPWEIEGELVGDIVIETPKRLEKDEPPLQSHRRDVGLVVDVAGRWGTETVKSTHIDSPVMDPKLAIEGSKPACGIPATFSRFFPSTTNANGWVEGQPVMPMRNHNHTIIGRAGKNRDEPPLKRPWFMDSVTAGSPGLPMSYLDDVNRDLPDHQQLGDASMEESNWHQTTFNLNETNNQLEEIYNNVRPSDESFVSSVRNPGPLEGYFEGTDPWSDVNFGLGEIGSEMIVGPQFHDPDLDNVAFWQNPQAETSRCPNMETIDRFADYNAEQHDEESSFPLLLGEDTFQEPSNTTDVDQALYCDTDGQWMALGNLDQEQCSGSHSPRHLIQEDLYVYNGDTNIRPDELIIDETDPMKSLTLDELGTTDGSHDTCVALQPSRASTQSHKFTTSNRLGHFLEAEEDPVYSFTEGRALLCGLHIPSSAAGAVVDDAFAKNLWSKR